MAQLRRKDMFWLNTQKYFLPFYKHVRLVELQIAMKKDSSILWILISTKMNFHFPVASSTHMATKKENTLTLKTNIKPMFFRKVLKKLRKKFLIHFMVSNVISNTIHNIKRLSKNGKPFLLCLLNFLKNFINSFLN